MNRRWCSIPPVPPLSVNPTTPILPLWIIAVLRLFWRNLVPQADHAIGYNQKKPAKPRTLTMESTDGRACRGSSDVRIVAVVDVWDAMRSDRPYRTGRPDEQVREHIRALVGTHFDPRVVTCFSIWSTRPPLQAAIALRASRSNTRWCVGLSGKG